MKKFYFFILITAGTLIFTFLNQSIKAATPETVTKHTPPLTGEVTSSDPNSNLSFAGSTDHIYNINGNLTLNGNIAGNAAQDRTGVIFVNGTLNINANYTYGSNTSGTVFVVKGNVNINQSVTRIDAVIISEGIIYTAGGGCATNSVTEKSPGVPIEALTINGSIISLNQDPALTTPAIKFCRTLLNNSLPAEKINHQVKYLVILKDLISDTWQKWSEIP